MGEVQPSPEKHETLKDRIIEAILRRIEGSKDLKKRLDYLMNPESLSSSARLSELQVQAISESCWLGAAFPSLKPLEHFALSYGKWSISRDGKGREEAVTVMVSETREILTSLGLPFTPVQAAPGPGSGKEGKGKDKK